MTHIYTLRLKSGDIFRFTSLEDEFTVEVDSIPVVGCHRDANNHYYLGVYPNTENFQPVLAIDPPVGKTAQEMTFDELLEASSLGSPEAWALRQSTPPDVKEAFWKAYEQRVSKLVAAAEPELAGGDDGPVERLAEEEPTDVDLESMKVYAPFDGDQVKQLTAFQDFGNFPPLSCGNNHGRPVNLMADEDGFYCPVEHCEYTQDWAWIAMLDQRNLLNSQFGHPNANGCTCKVVNTDGGWYIGENDPACKMHPQLVEVLEEVEIPDEDVEAAAKLMQPTDAITAVKDRDGWHPVGPEITRELLDDAIISPVNRTKTGRVLADAEVQQLADEAAEGNEEVPSEGSAATSEPSAATQPERLTAPHSEYPTEPSDDSDCNGAGDDDMTPEEFDEAMAKGTPVEVDVQLDGEGRGDGPETFDEANPSRQ